MDMTAGLKYTAQLQSDLTLFLFIKMSIIKHFFVEKSFSCPNRQKRHFFLKMALHTQRMIPYLNTNVFISMMFICNSKHNRSVIRYQILIFQKSYKLKTYQDGEKFQNVISKFLLPEQLPEVFYRKESTSVVVSFLTKLLVLIKLRLRHRSVPVNFKKFLRTSLSQNISEPLLVPLNANHT